MSPRIQRPLEISLRDLIAATLRFEKIANDVTGGATPDMVEEFDAARTSLRSSIRSARVILARQGKR